MKKDRKGFTMIELLATIVILGVISVIGIVSVTKVINSAKDNHYNTVLKNMKVAAESYFSDNRNNLPKVVGQNNMVTVKTLVDSKYLNPVKDNNDRICDYDESIVTVYKTAISSYKYVSTLKCDNYDNSKEAINGDLKIDISLTKPYNDKTDQATISSSDGVRSYRYKIFKNGVLLYDSGVINQGIRDKVTIGLDYKDQANNGTNIRVVVSATDIYGNTKQASSSVIVENKNAPLCGTSIKGSSTSWTKDNRTISINCKDNNDIKCKQARYSNTFDSTIKEGYITIEGDNGENTDCKVNAYVDKIIPTCSISGNPSLWTNDNQTLTVTGKDSDSGISNYSWISGDSGFSSVRTKVISANGTYGAWIIDNAGNIGSCSTKVENIDKLEPSCTISSSPNGFTNGNVTLTVTATEELATGPYSWTSRSDGFGKTNTKSVSSNGEYTAYAKDKAGNVGNCSANVDNIDKIPPTIQVGLPGPNSDSTYQVSITANDTGGSKPARLFITASNDSRNFDISSGSVTIYDIKAGNTYTVYATDKAGNKSTTKTFTSAVNNYNVSNHCWTVSLDKAIDCANTNDTISLLRNYLDNSSAIFKKNLTFTIQGFKFSRGNVLLVDGGAILNVKGSSGGVMTITKQNSNLIRADNESTANVYGPITYQDNGSRDISYALLASHTGGIINVLVENGKINSSGKGVATDGGTFNINMPNGEIRGPDDTVVWAKDGGYTNKIYNVKIYSNNLVDSNGTVYISPNQIVEIYDGVSISGNVTNFGTLRLNGKILISSGDQVSVNNTKSGNMSIGNSGIIIENNSSSRGTFKNDGNVWFRAGLIRNNSGYTSVWNNGNWFNEGGTIQGPAHNA